MAQLSEAENKLKENLERVNNTLYSSGEFRALLAGNVKWLALLKDIQDTLDENYDTYQKIKIQIDKTNKSLEANKINTQTYKTLSKDILVSTKSSQNILQKIAENADSLITGDLELKKIKQDINKAELTSLHLDIKKKELLEESGKLERALQGNLTPLRRRDFEEQKLAYDNLLATIEAEQGGLEKSLEVLRAQKREAKGIADKMTIFGRAMSSLKGFPGLSSILDLEAVEDAMQSTIAMGGKEGGFFKVMDVGVKSLGTEIVAALGPALYIYAAFKAVKGIFDMFMAADDRITRIQRNASLNVKDATKLVAINTKIANDSKLTYEQVQLAREKANELTGLSIVLNNKNAEAFGLMAENLKLSEDSLVGLLSSSFLLNSSIEDTVNTILGTSELLQYQTQTYLDDKKVLESVLKTSGGIRANFKGNVTELTKSVAKAQALGVSLEQITSFGEKLLDFESSISSELQAELITGKQLNLERARYYALTGDTNSLMKEMLANTGDIDNFTRMNVIQQKSLAEAFGMSRDEMSDMLFRTKQLNSMNKANYTERAKKDFIEGKSIEKQIEQMKLLGKTNDEIVRTLGKSVRGNLEQLRIDEEFAKRIDDLKSSFISNFKIETIREFFAVINRAMIWLNKFVAADVKEEEESRISKFRGNLMNEMFKVGIGTLAPLGLGAPLRGVNDSVISPQGKVMISTPEGMIRPNIKDSIITTTNPEALLNGGGDLNIRKELAQLTMEVKRGNDMITNAIRENKNIYINSTKLTETMNKYNNKLT